MPSISKHLFSIFSLLSLLLCGCGLNTEPKPDLTQFFIFTPMGESGSGNSESLQIAHTPTIGVYEVKLPAYLSSPRMVTRVSDNEIQFSEFERWGEPMEEGIARVLRDNLSDIMPGSDISWYPYLRPGRHDYQLYLTFLSFENLTNDKGESFIQMDVTWQIVPQDEKKDSEVSKSGELRLLNPVKPDSDATRSNVYSDIVESMSHTLYLLSERLAQDIDQLEAQKSRS